MPNVLTTHRDNTWPDDFITPDLIASETRWAFPGLVLHTSPYFARNKYGPFGYATARTANGDLCLYAWQRIARHQGRLFLAETGTISVRLRLCDGPGASEASLLGVMYGFAVDGYFLSARWNPYGGPPPAPKELGALNAPVLPSVEVSEAAPVAPRPIARVRATPTLDVAKPEVIMAPGTVPVPEAEPGDTYATVPPAD